MSQPRVLSSGRLVIHTIVAVGVPGYMAILAGAMGLAVLAPLWVLSFGVLFGVVMVTWLVPAALGPLLRPRWLALCAVLVFPFIFLVGPLDRNVFGMAYSSLGLETAYHALLRMVGIFLALNIFTSGVEISTLAGIFEKLGLHGLGFCLGVAMNLLPSMQRSAVTTWRVLQMRGGFRYRRWNGLRLMVITVISQALSRAEEIALAAEVRAFTPERAAAYPIARGHLDGVTIAVSILAVAAAIISRWI